MANKRKAVYTGIILDNPNDLLRWWKNTIGDVHSKKYAHHMTIKFKPSPSEVLALPIGAPVTLQIVGWAGDEKGQVVEVKASGGIKSGNTTPHVTVATDGTSPVYSNDLLARGIKRVAGPTLKGRVGLFTGKEDQFDLDDTIYEEPSKAAAVRSVMERKGAFGKTVALVVGAHGGDAELQQSALDLVNMELREEIRKKFGRISYRSGARPQGGNTMLRIVIKGEEEVLEAVREFTKDQLGMRWGGVTLSFTLFDNGRKVRI